MPRPIDGQAEFAAAGQALLAALIPVPKGIRLLGLGLHNLAEAEPMAVACSSGWQFDDNFVYKIVVKGRRDPAAAEFSRNVIERRGKPGRRSFWGTVRPRIGSAVSTDQEKGEKWLAKALSFDVGDYVVYPKHGVGRVVELQSTEIAGTSLDLYVLRFEKERMTLRVPVDKADSVGMRKLSSDKTMKDALETLKGKPKVKRTMWSRRAQEYEAKINSGDLTSIAEVTRDLFRADDQPEQSYSERQIFEAASSRLARELGAMEQTDEKTALVKILEILNKAAAIHNKAKEVAA